MRIALLDYGAGNLHSLGKALALAGALLKRETSVRRCFATDLLVLPGVGAFGPAARSIARDRDALRDAIHDGFPVLGICLGMQLLFSSSEEATGAGLGVMSGQVTRLRASRVPHIGWNTLEFEGESPLPAAWFANSYACRPADQEVVTAWSTHEGDRFPAMVRRGKVAGVQFHPEKSSDAGVRFLCALVQELCA